MTYLAFITILSLILCQVISVFVARARGKYGIKAPATTGSPEFERLFRAQMNTLEQLVVFLPAMWLFAYFLSSPITAAGIGALWILSRILYVYDYAADAEKRYPGMIVTLLCTLILSLGALFGILKQLIGF